ncbi:MAG: 50S ribosomal protein L22 [Deltaproteobacteria bacterium]|nr:50S ribosomal protein L22 [Deltaproteobacteria bacterium]MCL5791676.1 50S ribosomal protein L22 [Deltaproteobacteria bacterium]
MEIKASLKFLRLSPRKARLVADLVKGESVNKALAILRFKNRAASPHIAKLIRSAVANAETKGTIDIDNLYVKLISVTAGPTMKRFAAAPMGRAMRIRKRICHINLILDEK